MVGTLRTLMLAGLGALDFTEDKLRRGLDELVLRGELAENDARDLVAAWVRRATERRTALAEEVRRVVREELRATEVSRQEFETLADAVSRLEQRMSDRDDVPVQR